MTAPIVDALSLPRWSSTPVPAYDNAGSPASSGRTQNPFAIRQDLNSKVALWCVFIDVDLCFLVIFCYFRYVSVRAVARKKLITEVIGPWLSSLPLGIRVFMMIIKQQKRTK